MAKQTFPPNLTTAAKVTEYGVLRPLLEAMSRDFAELAKKKADAPLNKRKIEIVNRLLKQVFELLDGEPSVAYLDLLEEDDVPQNSDVMLILGQAVAAIESFKKRYLNTNREIVKFGLSWSTQENWIQASKS